MYYSFRLFETVGKTLTGLLFFDFVRSSYLKVAVTSANFSSSGNSLLIIVSLNNFVKVSEQLYALGFKMFGGSGF